MTPRRLIEVDLPIRKISAHARREKSIRHGHISTLHIWWARRPLAACRAVILAALWPDPADEHCPPRFRKEGAKLLAEFMEEKFHLDRDFSSPVAFREGLLDFIADFANWDNSNDPQYLKASRALVQLAHECLGGAPGSRPLVVDPFAGGGAIPLEALRVGGDAFASDLNPVAVLLNKVVLEYIPRYGQRLADEVRKWGEWVKGEAEKELGEFYPKDPDGAMPIAYLWARTITCEGPGCGTSIPLVRSLWLTKKGQHSVGLKLIPDVRGRRVVVEVVESASEKEIGRGTIRLGSATCPVCSFTTAVERVRAQLRDRKGGANDARLMCVVTSHPTRGGRRFRVATPLDLEAVEKAAARLARSAEELGTGPDEPVPPDGTGSVGGGFRTRKYGIEVFGDFFTARQTLALLTFAACTRRALDAMKLSEDDDLATAVVTLLALGVDRLCDRGSTQTRWDPTPTASGIINTFSRQALPMVWDFAEGVPFVDKSGGWTPSLEWIALVVEREAGALVRGQAQLASATHHPLPSDSVDAFVTDPPYYDAVPYADLSDFFYVWLRRSLFGVHPDLMKTALVAQEEECVVNLLARTKDAVKDRAFFEATICRALSEGVRITKPAGIGVVVFAHKSTKGWEALLQAISDAGWTITASWPIDTEMGNRLRAQNSAVLASSVHLVCRPRENSDGSLRNDDVGDWREVLAELPRRIHEWMPRLDAEGVRGADAIFACLGPALEIYSRHSQVEKSSGEIVTLKEYLEQIWAAVGKEALSMVFRGADATGFEEDARLTAMWLWTLSTGGDSGGDGVEAGEDSSDVEEEDAAKGGKRAKGGFALEYDAARKIAQGLGAHLEALHALIEVKGDTARLLPVSERASFLFPKGTASAAPTKRRLKQQSLPGMGEADVETGGSFDLGDGSYKPGETTLDRVHQGMLLFASGRSAALKRFLVDEGVGRDRRFKALAQALAALYPAGTEERRWVEGLLARFTGLGLS